MNEKLITVTGRGTICVVPDMTRLVLTLKSIHSTYEEAYVQTKNDMDKLASIMEKLQLDKTLPKTIHLDISKKIRNEYDKYDNYKGDIFLGYVLDHRLKIDLGMDNVLLNKIIRLIGTSLKQAEIDITHIVKDTRPYQIKMLERAVKDAKEKAAAMAKACGCRLGAVNSIDYSEHEIHIYSHARQLHEADEAIYSSPESLDITPDDMDVHNEVTVVWNLIENE